MGAQKGKTKEPEKRLARLSYLQIFRYGTWVENLATVVGAFLGLLSGGAICYNMVQFGEMSTALVERTTPQYHSQMSSYLPLSSLFGGGRRLVNASNEENMAALVEDVTASIAGVFVSTGICLTICVVSAALINWSALRQTTRIRNLFLKAVLRQDMAWFDMDTSFNLASSMSENMMKIKAGMGDKLSVVCNLLGTGIICLGQSFPLGWELTLSCATVIPCAIVVSVLLSNYQSKSSTKEMESYSQAGKQAEEVLKSVRTVLAFSGEQKEVERYRRLLEPAERYVRRRGLFTGLGNGFNWVLTYCLNTIGMAYGARLVLTDLLKPTDERRYQVGGIFSIQASMYMATQSITFCVPHIEAFSAARGAAAEVFHLIEHEPKIDSLSDKGISPRRVKGEIKFEDVHFSYPARSNVKVLNGFSIHVKPGEAVALVGSSGCGKTTILQLLQRLYDPHSGSVKLDGRNVKDVNISWLRTALGVVGQEPVLFRGTIFENITVGCPEATMEEVQRVAIMAYAHDFITRLADGYETMIGERGASLSGGQKQRVAIARALLREPAVLLLDEATSALDPHSERQVQAALDRASKGRTTLIVSHRLSTIVNADRIICMDTGVIVEEGTHQELMKAKGMYYNLVLTNNGGREPDLIEAFPEVPKGEPEEEVVTSAPPMGVRRSVKTRSNKKDCQEWMTPRGSISSAVSLALQNRIFNGMEEPEENIVDEEAVKPVSDWELLKLNSPEWLLVAVGSVAAVALGLCFPALALIWSNSAGIFALPNQEEIIHMADLLAGMFVVIAAVAGTAVCLQSYCFTSSGVLLTSRLRGKYFQSLLKQEMGYFDMESNTVGALCSRLSSDASEVQGATGMMIGLVLQGVTSVVVGLIIGLCYEWKLALVGAAFLPIMVGATWLEGIFYQKSQAQERDAIESATSIATEAVIGVRTVQSLGIERKFLAKFQEALEESCSAISRQSRWRGLVMGVGLYTPFVSSLCTLAYGAKLVAYEGLNYQYALLVMEATMYGAYMLGQSLVYAPSFNTARACGAKVLHLINRKPKIVTEPGVQDKDWKATGRLLFKDIEFGYPTRPQQKVLRGFNLKIEPGKTVALVGSSGCGKSTILQVLQRFYDPDTGNVEVDGQDTKGALTIPRLRRQLGVVQQEPVLFSRSLAENIAYGDTQRQVTMQEVIAAAKAANIHNFITSLPKGYDTFLGANGAQLSGGQKQRVCIARALIRSPRILLLDEATSALDANSERTVAEALEKAAQGRTCITVAHRLSTIINSDLICVLDRGRVVEQGSHSDLVKVRGLYWRLCKGQNLA